MSFIVPGGEVWLYRGVPLDDNYENVFRWPNGMTCVSIATYFNTAFSHTGPYSSLSYQRVDNQTFKVSVPAWEHYEDNYLVFHNSGNGGSTYDHDRYYFGFITDVLYINDNCTQFTYKIDWITTWLSYCEFEDCFIERCTPDSDEIGDNIIPEQLECGEYVYGQKCEPVFDSVYYYENMLNDEYTFQRIDIGNGLVNLKSCSIVIMICDVENNLFGTKESLTSVDLSYAENTISGATIYVVPYADRVDNVVPILNEFLDSYKERPQAIIDMYMVPRLSVSNIEQIAEQVESNVYKINTEANHTGVVAECHFEEPSNSSLNTFGGYKPINKKLYTYPFNYLTIFNGDGEQLNLRYEFFTPTLDAGNGSYLGDYPEFRIETTMLNPVQMRILPIYYKSRNSQFTMVEQLSIASFPHCSWNMDYYSAWVAQNSVPIAVNTVTSLISGALGGAMGYMSAESSPMQSGEGYTYQNMGNGLGGAIQSAGNLFNSFYRASITADMYNGNLSVGNLNCAQYENMFYAERTSVNAQMAECIDNFFSMFGYAQKKVVNPYDIINENGLNYCYIKTAGCQVGGEIPTKAREAIETIFNKGVRLWDFVGNKSGNGNLGDVLDNAEDNNGPHHWNVIP